MKNTSKISFIALLTVIAVGSMSTVTNYGSADFNSRIDSFTLANTTTHVDTIVVKGNALAFGFDFYVKKNSGTLGGSIAVYSSVDASGFRMTSAALYTATLSNADTNLRYRVSSCTDRKFVILVTQTGTTNATYSIHGIKANN